MIGCLGQWALLCIRFDACIYWTVGLEHELWRYEMRGWEKELDVKL